MWKITSERFVFKPVPIQWTLGLYSLGGKTSYHQISRSLEVARLDVIYNDRIAPKFDRHLGSAAADVSVKL